MEQILIENSNLSNRSIKNYVLKHNLIDFVCSECGLPSEWNGKPLVLQLEHRNGVNNDHRLENLTFLCPNCHSQTDTYAGRNNTGPRTPDQLCVVCQLPKAKNAGLAHPSCVKRTKIDWPSSEVLDSMVKEFGYSETARKLGVSDVSVHKRLKKYPA